GVQTTYYRDLDGDTFGDPANTTMACSLPTGYVTNSSDCNDGNSALNPNTIWYLDADGDNYYTGAGITQCASPGAGYRYTGILGGGDCNDGNAAINPAATEVCDGIDDNCDGSIDEGCIPDYIITTTGNGIIITDITGSSETLEMSQSGGDINFNVAGRTYSLDGGFVTAFPVNVPLAGATFITIHTETGNDIINIGAFTAVLPSLTVNGGTDDDVVNFNGDITFAANANLDVDLQNDHTTPGVDQINILTGNNILLSGTGSVMMTASLNIFLDNNARIETTNGNLTLEANQQPVASTGYFIGINLFSGAIIRSVNGAVSLAGRGGTADGTQYGIENMGTIATTGTGNILLEGTGGLIGTDNDGVRNIGTISATGSGDIQITGTSTGSAASEAFANQLGSAVSTTSGDIKVDADIIYIDPTSSISAGANKVSIAPTTAGRSIDLGLDDSFTQLGLTDAELDRITAGTLVIGNAGSGAITVSAAITRPAATNMQLISNSNVTIADGGINTAGGTILLDPGAFPATVRPTFNGTDVTAGTLSFGGDLTIVINNTTAGSGYRQLTVSGVVNITGVDLRLDGSYSPSGGETFTIVDNDGSADAIIGTFNGLPQGATITNFLGSNFNATISYTGGNGNDVVITVINNVVCYADTDGDGFGDPNNSMTFSGSCGTGFVSNADDCDDSNNALNPNTVWYLDADNDNYYTGSGVTQCASPGAGYRYTGLTAGGDCNDNNAAINPAASEVCDGIDNDCNGMIDDGLSFVTYYQDSDGDTFGNPAVSQSTCDGPPTGYVSNNLDCNDSNNALNPNTVWYLDADGDGYYTGTGVTQCASPGAGYRYTGILGGGDCNDDPATGGMTNPGATESCNGIDDNCNGMVDEGLSFVTYYQDSDGDTFGNPAVSQSTCDGPPAGYVSNNLD
ncbi:MAG TPA: putative metal-binding motif-containing protein, partial [Saprospiraceae bacterium]|nr:putative metal-binding motif-containing protein [Saprospiraceae bacterium]